MPVPEHKLYQLIITRLDGNKIEEPAYREHILELAGKGIGGFIIFGGRKDEVKPFISKLQSIAETTLLIASDIERGVGQQLEGTTNFPGQMSLSAAFPKDHPDSAGNIQQVIKTIASEAIDTGINMPLAPVLDVNSNADNPIICTRAFSDNPDTVAWYGTIFIETLESAGLISCAKHFPGHGDTSVDSHISLPVISKSVEDLVRTDLLPFIEAIKAGAGSIMLGHLSIPAIEEVPTTFSKNLITVLLRNKLGFKGLILTDALNMHALDEYSGVPSKAIAAGADILLHPADADNTVEDLKQGLASGFLTEEQVDGAYERIMLYKSRIYKNAEHDIDYRKHSTYASGISDMAITLVKDSPGALPIIDPGNASFIFDFDENRHDIAAMRSYAQGSINLKDHGALVLKDTLIFALFTNVAAWQGSSGISSKSISLIHSLIEKSAKSIIISFGSPYILRHFGNADTLIASYDTSPQAQASVIRCLKGETAFKGSLPVSLNFP